MNGDDRSDLQILAATVRGLDAQVSRLSDKLDAAAAALRLQDKINSDTAKDHEIRLRSVERWKNALPVSTIITMATLAIGVFALLTRG